MSAIDGMEELGGQTDALNESLGSAAQMAASFDDEMGRIRAAFAATGKDVATLERGLSRGLRSAFDDVVFGGENLSGALGSIAKSISNTAYSAAVRPVTNHFGGLLADGVGDFVKSLFPFENGGSFSQGRVMPFANGGVVSAPTTFPMRGGWGLMGEAGPEAIMPLARGADGKLGVRGGGGGVINVVMNITTPDVTGFQRSQSQIAAQMGRALSRGQRNR